MQYAAANATAAEYRSPTSAGKSQRQTDDNNRHYSRNRDSPDENFNGGVHRRVTDHAALFFGRG